MICPEPLHSTSDPRKPDGGTSVSVGRIIRQREALIGLTSRQRLAAPSLQESLRQITEVAARTLGVARVGVWRYTSDATANLRRATSHPISIGTSASTKKNSPVPPHDVCSPCSAAAACRSMQWTPCGLSMKALEGQGEGRKRRRAQGAAEC